MSPSDFAKAWDQRNERLREGGVFEYVTDLTDAHGWKAIEKMTASELIGAVADLGLTPSGAASPRPAEARKQRANFWRGIRDPPQVQEVTGILNPLRAARSQERSRGVWQRGRARGWRGRDRQREGEVIDSGDQVPERLASERIAELPTATERAPGAPHVSDIASCFCRERTRTGSD
jgi:hypothetical protein